MRLERRIPTILGILIIAVSLGVTVFLFRSIRNLSGQATADTEPQEVKITNLNDGEFTVSWITNDKTNGAVSFGENPSLGNIARDDRDQVSGKTGDYETHHITLRYLKPSSKYYFKIISGETTFDHNGEPYLVSTAPKINPSEDPTHPTYGTVVMADGNPAEGAIVYLNLNNSTPLSTLVKSSGNWLVTLNNARTIDLSDFVKLSEKEKIEIFIQAGSEGTAQAITTIANDSPVPQITLGKTYDFSQAVSTPTPTPTPAAPTGETPTPTATSLIPSLTTPASGSAVPSDRPLFEGKGIPGETVTIKIESSSPVSGTAQVDQSGNWTWTPPTGLSPGEHTATITTTDSNGQLVTLSRKFIVLASGTQVVEAATPSASLTPSPRPTSTPVATPVPTLAPTPSPTPVLTPVPTPTPVPEPTPTSGNINPTIFILLLGMIFIIFGATRLLLLDNSQNNSLP